MRLLARNAPEQDGHTQKDVAIIIAVQNLVNPQTYRKIRREKAADADDPGFHGTVPPAEVGL